MTVLSSAAVTFKRPDSSQKRKQSVLIVPNLSFPLVDSSPWQSTHTQLHRGTKKSAHDAKMQRCKFDSDRKGKSFAFNQEVKRVSDL